MFLASTPIGKMLFATGGTNRSRGVPISQILSPQPYFFISSTSCFFPCHLFAQLPPFSASQRSRHENHCRSSSSIQWFSVSSHFQMRKHVRYDQIFFCGLRVNSFIMFHHVSSHRNSIAAVEQGPLVPRTSWAQPDGPGAWTPGMEEEVDWPCGLCMGYVPTVD